MWVPTAGYTENGPFLTPGISSVPIRLVVRKLQSPLHIPLYMLTSSIAWLSRAIVTSPIRVIVCRHLIES